MNLGITVALIVLVFVFFELKMAWAAWLTILFLAAELIGGVVAKFFSFIGAIARGTARVAESEAKLVDKAEPYYPSGKEVFKTGFEKIGTAVGKSRKATKESKKIEPPKELFGFVGDMSDRLMNAVTGLFKK